jgi:hypothetical protein
MPPEERARDVERSGPLGANRLRPAASMLAHLHAQRTGCVEVGDVEERVGSPSIRRSVTVRPAARNAS